MKLLISSRVFSLSISLHSLSLFPPLRGSPTEAGKRLKRERERGEEYDQRVVGWLVGWLVGRVREREAGFHKILVRKVRGDGADQNKLCFDPDWVATF